jgi:hypothetical protein
MTRYTLHVPELLNDGSGVDPAYFAGVEARLLDLSDGFTLTHGIGAWRHEGTVYHEPVRLYALDVPSGRGTGHALSRIARDIAADLRQEAVYVTEAPITAQLVTAPTIPA